MRVTELDPATASPSDWAAWAELLTAIQDDRQPGDPPVAAGFVRPWLCVNERHFPHRYFLVWDGAELVAAARCGRWETGDNAHRLESDIDVRPGHTEAAREGIRTAVRVARECGRRVVGLANGEGEVGGVVAREVGAALGQLERQSLLRFDQTDMGRIPEWAAADPAGYELVRFDLPCPDELLDDYVALGNAMNTAPRDELDMEDFVVDADRVRETERVHAERGFERWVACARHLDSGRLVAYTELSLTPPRLWLADQDNTAVMPGEHRGHGLGRWVKAANIQRLLTECPEVRAIETWNAGSNDHMLAINVELGFRPEVTWELWDLDVDTAGANL